MFDVDLDKPPDPNAWHVDITAALKPNGAIPLSLNSRLHWAAHAKIVDRIKAITRNAIITAEVPPMPAVHVEMHYRPANNARRDRDNLVATLKPALDALHQPDLSTHNPVPYEPIVPGDDPRYVSWEPPILHPWRRGVPPALWLILRPMEAT